MSCSINSITLVPLALASLLLAGTSQAKENTFVNRGGHALLRASKTQGTLEHRLQRTPLPRALRRVPQRGRAAAGRALMNAGEDQAPAVELHPHSVAFKGNRIDHALNFNNGVAVQRVTHWKETGTSNRYHTGLWGLSENRGVVRSSSEDWSRDHLMVKRNIDAYEAPEALTLPSGKTIAAGSWVVAKAGMVHTWGRGVGQSNQEIPIEPRYQLWQWKDGARGRVRVKSVIPQQDFEFVKNQGQAQPR